jgi:hypothetical protein
MKRDGMRMQAVAKRNPVQIRKHDVQQNQDHPRQTPR